VQDATGTNIRVDTRGPEVLRILPRINDDVNEEWMADRGRFSFDGLKKKRLDRPWLRVDGKLKQASWAEALGAVAAKLRDTAPQRIGAIAGDLVDCESVFALKTLMHALGSHNLDCRADGAQFDVSRPDFWRFNTTIAGIERADALLIVGGNPRHDAPVINARIRKRHLLGKFPIGRIGAPGMDLTYSHQYLGESIAAHPFFETFNGAKHPMVIVGRNAGAEAHAAAWRMAAAAKALRADWHGFNVLHRFGGQVGALELGFVPGEGANSVWDSDVLWLLGADNFDPSRIHPSAFVIYQGHHGDRAASRADVILPGAAYTEKDATYVNTEGRAQRAWRAVHPPGEAREDWRIVRALAEGLGVTLGFDTLEQLRETMPLSLEFAPRGCDDMNGPDASLGTMPAEPFAPYHLADVIARASDVMAECARVYGEPPAMAAE
jgi:NADH-quinone oxidoreductase subunit G